MIPAENAPAPDGRRARKRAETRARILAAAQALFLAKGFDATTIEEIAERADISKRSFFDYFPTKEDVVVSWQDDFGDLLAQKVAERPVGEPLAQVVANAMAEAISLSLSPEGTAMDRLVRETPSLRGRLHLKYVNLEHKLAEALATRGADETSDALVSRPALLAMIAVGALRLGSDAWTPGTQTTPADLSAYTASIFDSVWQTIADLGPSRP